MQSLQLYNNETDHTTSQSHVYVNNNKVYQITDSYRDLASKEQMDRVLENLIIEKGFVLDSQREHTIKLTNPTDSETVYWLWTDTLGINKRTNRMVGELD